MPQIYACRKCGRTYSFEEYDQSRFCRECEALLVPKNKIPKFYSRNVYSPKQIVEKKPSTHFPKDYEIRKGQSDFIREATKALNENKIFLGSAPCGIGKSLASLLAILPKLKENKLLISFRTRNQLRIYLQELKALRLNFPAISFISKQSMCPLNLEKNLSYFDFFEVCKRLKDNSRSSKKPQCKFYANMLHREKEAEKLAINCAQKLLSPLEMVNIMSIKGFCAYEVSKKILNKVKIFLGTYHYIFNPQIRDVILKSLGVDLTHVFLIIDEAHNLPAFSRELLSDKLVGNILERAFNETRRFPNETSSLVQEYLNLLDENVFKRAKRTLKNNEVRQLHPNEVNNLFLNHSGIQGTEAATILREYGDYVKQKRQELGYERLLSYNFRIGDFMEDFFEKTESMYIHLLRKTLHSKVSLELKCLDGRQVSNSVLRSAKGAILMSGSLSPLEVYRDLMLYDNSDTQLNEFDSPFPPENRLIIVGCDVSSKFERRTKDMLGRWKKYIEAIAQANNGNMAVFFTSYDLMHTLLPLINTGRHLIIEGRKTSRENVISELKSSNHNILFGVMGAKFSEGMDYPNNLLTCVVVVGFPYATWNVYQRTLINFYNQQFSGKGEAYAYQVPAVLRLIQACGRVHRSDSDKGCIVILDERVAYQQIKNQLPSYFQEEMRLVNNPSDCAKLIQKFWAP